ncbi:thioester reductase domain-containing protein [Kitasatospora sp. NPDC050543]|uniref:thioester reductase domain-containing protein n=1 Tax=Kitasatospora sp. NPDC050543 TaxID=3364054 RepID=UPI0037B9199F
MRLLPAPGGGTREAPDPLERLVLAVWEEVLGRGGLSVHDDFFELDGQSLHALRVAGRLADRLGREVAAHAVVRHPTAAALAGLLRCEPAATAERDADPSPGDLPADAVLPAEVRPAGGPARVRRAADRVLLITGATGFVGVHLLHELLTGTDARIVCAVRADSCGEGLNRLRRAMAERGLPDPRSPGCWEDRVQVLPSDLARPRLGLDRSAWERLASDCDAIYHSAAAVSLTSDYRSIRTVNVGGTSELLRLAAAGRPTALHHLSTLALCPPGLGESGREGFLAPHPGLTGGYLKSKWAAEHLLAQAAARGLRVAVYRLGRVTEPPTTAGVDGADVFWRLLCEVVRARELPRVPGVAGALGMPGAPGGGLGGVREVWTPADYVALAVVRLSAMGTATGTGAVFNLAPHPPTDLSEILDWVADYGFAIPRLPGGLPLPARDNLAADTRPPPRRPCGPRGGRDRRPLPPHRPRAGPPLPGHLCPDRPAATPRPILNLRQATSRTTGVRDDAAYFYTMVAVTAGPVRDGRLPGRAVAASMDEHARLGGVAPESAARAHVHAVAPGSRRRWSGASPPPRWSTRH